MPKTNLKLPWQFWQAGLDCHDHKKMAPSEKSAIKRIFQHCHCK